MDYWNKNERKYEECESKWRGKGKKGWVIVWREKVWMKRILIWKN